MLVSKASRRYANALLEIALVQNSVEEMLNDMLTIKSTIEGSRELLLFLRSPIVKPTDKQQALQKIFEGKVSKTVSQFITLITEKGRENILDQIANAFVEAYNQHAGIITVEVKTAKALSDKQAKELTAMLEKTTSKKVNLDFSVIEELRGGISIKIDDTVIDATIKHKLEQLETQFLQ